MEKRKNEIADVRERLKSGKLEDDDIKFINFVLDKAEREGLGEKIGGRWVVATLPNGMDLVK